MKKLSPSQRRTLQYMADTGCLLAGCYWSTGYTVDAYQWPVNGMTMGILQRDDDQLWIGTLEGNMIASAGDWIIRGVKGELYPCKPDIFAATYEPVALTEETPNAE